MVGEVISLPARRPAIRLLSLILGLMVIACGLSVGGCKPGVRVTVESDPRVFTVSEGGMGS